MVAQSIHPVDLMSHQLFRLLSELELDRDHFAIFGSAPMFIRGIIPEIGDLDIVARGPAWDRACQLGIPTFSQSGTDPVVHFWGGKIEVFRVWEIPYLLTTDILIDHAEWFAGFRFVRLEYVLTYKWYLDRPKDKTHLDMLRSRFKLRAARSPK
jgi:hypothetical protein